MCNKNKVLLICFFFLWIFPGFIFSSPIGLEIQSNIYYGLPVTDSADIFYNYAAADDVLDFQFDLSYLIDFKLTFERTFLYLGIINQHNFLSSQDQAFIDQFYEPPEYASRESNRLDYQKYNLAFALGYGIFLFPKSAESVFNIDLSASLYLHILGVNYQIQYADAASYVTNYNPDYSILEIHARLSAYYRILSWLRLASFFDISAANLNLFLVPQFIGGSNYFSFDLIFTPFSNPEDMGLSVSFLYEFSTYNDTTIYNILPGFDSRDIVQSPRIGVGIRYGQH